MRNLQDDGAVSLGLPLRSLVVGSRTFSMRVMISQRSNGQDALWVRR